MTLTEMAEQITALIKDIHNCRNLPTALDCLKQNAKSASTLLNQQTIQESKHEFDAWLLKLFNEEPFPKKVNGLYFGLFETSERRLFRTEESFSLYVSGSYKWSKVDPDWPTEHEYWPEQRYAQLSILSRIHKLKDVNEYTKYFLAQATSILYIKVFFEEHLQLPELNDLKFNIGIGFDDGDLYNLFKFPDMTAIK